MKRFESVPLLYIADGHHRAASAAALGPSFSEQSFGHTGDEEYNFFLAVMFPDDQLRILPYNRIVRDLNGMSPDQFLDAVEEHLQSMRTRNRATGTRKMEHVFGRPWYGLQLSPATTAPQGVVDSLDVSVLQNRLLDPILGIKDVRTDKRIDFIGGIRGTEELESLVDDGKAAVAFSLYPTTIEDLLRVSDAGEIMPPKSTWFEPKLRDGLLIHGI